MQSAVNVGAVFMRTFNQPVKLMKTCRSRLSALMSTNHTELELLDIRLLEIHKAPDALVSWIKQHPIVLTKRRINSKNLRPHR